MNVWQRAITALNTFFNGKTAYEYTNTWDVGQPVYPDPHFQNNVKFGLRKNELIYSCIALKADSAAQTRLLVHNRKDGAERPEHPLRSLIGQPNPYMTEFDFVGIVLMMLDLAGRCVWEKERSRAGRVVGLWPLRPDWLLPVRGPTGFPMGYEYHVPGAPNGRPIPLDSRDVLEFKLWDPLDMYNGLAPVSVAGRVGDVDNAATDYLKRFFEHGGVPQGILSSKLKLTDPQVTDIRRRWRERYGGWAKWMEPAVLDSDATYQQTGLDFKEMGFEVLDARAEARICAVLGVPPILVGAKVGLDRSTFSNAEQAEKYFWQHTLMPVYKRIRDELQSDLATEFGSDVELRWDLSEVAALQEDQGKVWERARASASAGIITINEARDQMGLPAVRNGDVFIRTLTMMEVPALISKGQKALEHSHEHKAGEAPDNDDRRKAERALQRDMESYFKAQLGRIKDEVERGGVTR